MMLLALALGTCMAAGVLMLGLRRAPDPLVRRSASHWFMAISSVPLGWLLLEWALGGGPVWLFVLGKVLIMGAFVEFLRAARLLRRPAEDAIWLHGFTLFVLLATTVWLLGWPQVQMRSSLLSLLCGVLALWAGIECWRGRQPRAAAFALVVSAGLLTTAVALLLRAMQYASDFWGLREQLPQLPPGALLGLMLAALVVATLGFALLLSDVYLRTLAGTGMTTAVRAMRVSKP